MAGRWGHDGLELDRGQSAQRGLPSAAVVGPLDPGDDRDSQLLAGRPATPIQDVPLEESEEAFHRGVVTGGADSAHRSDHVVTVQSADELPASELPGLKASSHHPAHRGRRRRVGRQRRRRLRQRLGRDDDRPVRDREDQPRRPLEDDGRRRARDPRMGRLVQSRALHSACDRRPPAEYEALHLQKTETH